mmetsp:Transcript_51777/g.112247  ORF Transcript_51777/g.112247 Transcript_51777/m.112247 type:complete len:233 (+) Transcript_51777:1930-2628(+)
MASARDAMAEPRSSRKSPSCQLPKLLTATRPLPGKRATVETRTCTGSTTCTASRGPSGCERATKAAEVESSALRPAMGAKVPEAKSTACALAAKLSKMTPGAMSHAAMEGPDELPELPVLLLEMPITYELGCRTVSCSFASSSRMRSNTPRTTASSGTARPSTCSRRRTSVSSTANSSAARPSRPCSVRPAARRHSAVPAVDCPRPHDCRRPANGTEACGAFACCSRNAARR